MECDAAEKPVAKRWYVLDLVLFGGFALAYVGFFAAISVMDYMEGLRGGLKSFDSFVVCGLPVVMLVWFLALPVRILTGWRKHIRSRRRLVVLCLSASVGLAAWVALPFLGLWLPGCEPFMHGFRHHMRANTDLGAIRGWLNTLDLNLCTGEYIDLYTGNDLKSHWPDAVAWPDAITRFDPHYVQLMKTESGRPKVRLTWGGAPGHWGVEIGPEDMPIPETLPRRTYDHYGQELWDEGEYRLPLAPGAYVWHEIQ